jgi:S-adenosylmethionine:tRNA ribosyltransferase-isomerase
VPSGYRIFSSADPKPYNLPVLVSDFRYHLPPEQIAQEPIADRAGSRMLYLCRSTGHCQDRMFRDFPDLLREGDLLVINNTRVFPARLYGRRSGERAHSLSPHNPASRDFLQGHVEVLLSRQTSTDPNEWECLVRPGRKIGIGEKVYFGDPIELEAEVIERGGFGERRIRFKPTTDFFARLERIGHVPLPPYIDREDRTADQHRYQTVYAKDRGSVAAPTAGLHFTTEILERIRNRGIEIAEVTLHVGLGTFQPVRVARVEDHKLHCEQYEISAEAARAVSLAKQEKRRVFAVGTTTVRTLEYAALTASNGFIEAGRGEADLFIYPGFQFRIVDALLTNFHLPESTLLILLCAFGGTDPVMSAYHHAVDAGYRFYSYGDCMFVE